MSVEDSRNNDPERKPAAPALNNEDLVRRAANFTRVSLYCSLYGLAIPVLGSLVVGGTSLYNTLNNREPLILQRENGLIYLLAVTASYGVFIVSLNCADFGFRVLTTMKQKKS